ncbi:hypothetical protein ECG_02086 [Echinococcus granulosus]|nr:hypothetical protein ECG_02086 [Echinococcus granulosus]
MHGSRVDEGGSLHEFECASAILAFFFSPPSSFLPPLPPPPLPPPSPPTPPLPPSPHPHLPNSLHSSSRSHLYSSLPQAQPPSSSTAPSPSHFFFSSRFICLPRFLFVFTFTASLLLPLTFTLVSVPSSTTFPSHTPSLPSPTNTHTPIESVASKVDKLCVIMYRVGRRESLCNCCHKATRRRSICLRDRLEFADRTGIHNLLNLTILMSAIFELTESTSVSPPRFISNPELPFFFVWITLIIIYVVSWIYLRDRAPCPPTLHPSRQREPLPDPGEPNPWRDEKVMTFVVPSEEADETHLRVVCCEEERQTNWIEWEEQQAFSAPIRVLYRGE